MAGKVKVEGKEKALKAFDKVESKVQDLSKGHKAAAEMLLPDVQSATRKRSGDLASGWQADGIATQAQFSNNLVYAPIQEFGWSDHNIEPTRAIDQAFEANAERTEAVYAEAIADIAGSAGFDTDKT